MKFILKSTSRTPMVIRLPHIGPVNTPSIHASQVIVTETLFYRSLSALTMPISSIRRSVL
jgi:hypothetical protein